MGLFVDDDGILDTYSDDRSIDNYRKYRGDDVCYFFGNRVEVVAVMETVGGRIDRGCLTRGCIDSRLRSWLDSIYDGA